MTEKALEITSNSVEQTIAIGKAIGQGMRGDEVVALIGDLGTGKTHLIKGIASGIGVDKNDDVTSPTFTLINEYAGEKLSLYHIDAYRLKNAAQLEALGFDEMCSMSSVVVIEWADRVWSLVSEYEPICVRLHHRGETARELHIEGLSDDIAKAISQCAS